MQAITLFFSLLTDVVQAQWLRDKSTADFTAPFTTSRLWLKFDERKKGGNWNAHIPSHLSRVDLSECSHPKNPRMFLMCRNSWCYKNCLIIRDWSLESCDIKVSNQLYFNVLFVCQMLGQTMLVSTENIVSYLVSFREQYSMIEYRPPKHSQLCTCTVKLIMLGEHSLT